MTLLDLVPLYLMIFAPPTIVPLPLIRSFSFHLLSNGKFIGSNLMLLVPKFRFFWWWPHFWFLQLIDYGILPIQSSLINERDTKSVEYTSPGGDDIFFDPVSRPSKLDLLFDWFPLEERLNWFIWNPLLFTINMFIVSLLLNMYLQNIIYPPQLHKMPHW